MFDVKQQVSEWLSVDQNYLNEIALEDVEFEEAAQQNINRTISQMLLNNEPVSQIANQITLLAEGLPCRSFWVENSKDLVLFVWNGNHAKTIVVPHGTWTIRNDITIN